MAKVNDALHDLLYGERQRFGYLFPYRERIPKVKKHLFSTLKEAKQTTDEFLVSKMLDINYIGWTTKAILNIDLFPVQIAILQTMWEKTFPMLVGSRGGSKSFLLAVYAVLRALLDPGTKIVIIGAGLRQAKLVFNYIETMWNSAPMLRNLIGGGKKAGPRQNVDLCYFRVGESIIYALPLGDGSKIRGFRANVVIADEFASIPEDVFDVVVRGFAATTKTPVDEARRLAFDKDVAKLNIPANVKKMIMSDKKRTEGNQIIYSGTAYYAFNHFSRRFDMWCDIIRSGGDLDEVAKIFGGISLIPDNFDYSDYAVINLPYTHVPEGLLDQKQLAHAKAILPRNIFLMEYGAKFVKDSDGFFPRSLIEACSTGPGDPIITSDGEITFTPMMRGKKGCRYVIGIDPAAELDRFAMVVLEVWPNHYRVVYCWAMNKPEFKRRKKEGLITDDDYYAYCCAKIRWAVRMFFPIRIEMDSQGGGYPISEMLRNKKLLDKDEGDFPIYETIDEKDPKETDGETDGPHILHLVQQSNIFNLEGNVCLHKSLETKTLLFPAFDTVKMQAALIAEKSLNVTFDTYEDCVQDIEELKNELCTIQRSETTTGKGRFDTPAVVAAGAVEGRQRKGRLRKDRYTALLLGHKYVYDTDVKPESPIDYDDVPGNFQKFEKVDPSEGMYRGDGVGRMRNSADWNQGGGGFGATKGGEKL